MFTATSKADFLKQILDTVRTYPVGQYVIGVRRNGYYFCLTIVAIQNSDRVIAEAIPQVGNLNEILIGTYNSGSYIYSKVTTTSFTVDNGLITIRTKTISIDATTQQGSVYGGEHILTSAEKEGAKLIMTQFARKSGYGYPLTCGFEGSSVRVQSPISLTGITVGLVLFFWN